MGGPTPARYLGSAAPGRAAARSLDPRAILTSLGEVVYDWDVAADTISWGLNAADVFGISDLSLPASGKAFALATESESGSTRHEVILASGATDAVCGECMQPLEPDTSTIKARVTVWDRRRVPYFQARI